MGLEKSEVEPENQLGVELEKFAVAEIVVVDLAAHYLLSRNSPDLVEDEYSFVD